MTVRPPPNWVPVAIALALIALATLLPTAGPGAVRGPWLWCVPCGDYGMADAVANVALFVPLGWALARAGVPPAAGIALALLTTIAIESLQYAFIPGRDASVSDVITNTLGAIVGTALTPLRRWIGARRERALYGAVLYAVTLVVGLSVSAATQAVRLPRALRWTGGSMETSEYVPFTGSLGGVQVHGLPVALYQWSTVPSRDSVEVAVEFLSGRPDTGLAQIVIAWMPRWDGWMWLEQRGRDLRVHLASLSDHLRLRGHSAWLRGALPAKADDSVSVRLLVRRFSYRIAVRTTVGDVVREARIGVGDGWRLFVPFERERERWAGWLAGGWMAALCWPLGYLATMRSRVIIPCAAAVGAGLVLSPIIMGCGGLTFYGWCGGAAGMLTGALPHVE
jgi:VanZ like family